MNPITLHDLLLRTRRSIALNFPQAIWVKAEINQITERRGHHYLELLENSENSGPIAKCSAVVWSRQYQQVLRKRGETALEVLSAGQEVCLQVDVDFHEVYGFKVSILDWDPAFTIGQLELQRQAIINSLKHRNLLGRNRALTLPHVVQRLAVLTSSRAAGYADFLAQLKGNLYGYHFELTHFDISVQGNT